jgi:hypothetical protein
VRINDGDAAGVDTSFPVVEVTDALRAGNNSVVVRVASSLNNRLLSRGYYEDVLDMNTQWGTTEPRMQSTSVHPHGLLGPARLLRARSDR